MALVNKSSEASAGQQGIWYSAFCGSKIPMAYVVWALASLSECESLQGVFFRGGFAAIPGDGHILCFSGHIEHSKNTSIPLVLWSHYHCSVKCEFISLSFQGLCSALTVNTIKNVCGRGDPRVLDGQHVLMGHHRFSFFSKGCGLIFLLVGAMGPGRSRGQREAICEGISGRMCLAAVLAPSSLCERSDESLLLFPKDLCLCRHKLLLIYGFFPLYFSLYGKPAIDGFCPQHKETNNTYRYAAGRKIAQR